MSTFEGALVDHWIDPTTDGQVLHSNVRKAVVDHRLELEAELLRRLNADRDNMKRYLLILSIAGAKRRLSSNVVEFLLNLALQPGAEEWLQELCVEALFFQMPPMSTPALDERVYRLTRMLPKRGVPPEGTLDLIASVKRRFEHYSKVIELWQSGVVLVDSEKVTPLLDQVDLLGYSRDRAAPLMVATLGWEKGLSWDSRMVPCIDSRADVSPLRMGTPLFEGPSGAVAALEAEWAVGSGVVRLHEAKLRVWDLGPAGGKLPGAGDKPEGMGLGGQVQKFFTHLFGQGKGSGGGAWVSK